MIRIGETENAHRFRMRIPPAKRPLGRNRKTIGEQRKRRKLQELDVNEIGQ
jgi:hypothetical protein